MAPLLGQVARLVDYVLPERQMARIRTNLEAAGFSSTRDLPTFLAAKALLAAILAGTGALLAVAAAGPPGKALLLAAIGGLAGFYLPGIWLGKRIAGRRQQLARALPDALDLLSISVSAGLGFDSAMLEVVQRWANPLTEEFAAVLRDMRLGRDRRQALRSLAERAGVPELRSVVAAIVQADELGTPVRETLRVQADQMRLQRRQQAEERARQATIKMLIPMAMFIFPTIFVVLIGPSIPSFMGLVKR
jgi:tight adherence protein C